MTTEGSGEFSKRTHWYYALLTDSVTCLELLKSCYTIKIITNIDQGAPMMPVFWV